MAWGDNVAAQTADEEAAAKAKIEARDAALMAWETAKETLATAKEDEMTKRKAAFALTFENAREGTNTVELGNGYEAKGVRKVNYGFGDASNAKIEEAEDKAATLGNEGTFIIERVIKWTAEISVSEYKKLRKDAEEGSKLAKDMLVILDEIVVTKDGAPTLDIKAPKAALNG